MTVEEITAKLRALNPRGRPDLIALYADAYRLYHEAAENVRVNGGLVEHPRTGEFAPNPYLGIMKTASAMIAKIRLNVGDLWGAEPVAGGKKLSKRT